MSIALPRRHRDRVEPDRTPQADSVASTVRALAVLLEAGVAPVQAWRHLAAGGDEAAASVLAAPTGRGVADALAEVGGDWRPVAQAWRIAEVVGAPMAPSLRAIAAAHGDAVAARDDVRVALAEPAATARLVSWLPLIAVALGFAFGFDIVATLTHPLGLACLVGGGALMLVAHRWTRRLVAAAQPVEQLPGLRAELLAIALSGGASIGRACDVLAASDAGEPDEASRRVLALSETAGAPAVELLRASAAEARADARTAGKLRAAKLSSTLLIPLGVCTLPAFLLLGVGPMLLSVLSGSAPAF
ncbi:type II secretion system F family protein [Microbacterium sp. bgisy189]|uniref:type II secretion system F family protein n=1 Tax=Microbacterium sp. bgisy189 TaxID=3413798 RepID=UPI003EC06B1E